jgi:2-polyprenyl-6-methoxyphenol hydroxylase-like FAD-dependent oxidoreductase
MRVLIVGGGLGGLCLAQGLSTMGVDVTVSERDPSPTFRGRGYRISLKDSGVGALRDCLPSRLYALAVATSIRAATRMVFLDAQLRPSFSKPLPAVDPAAGGFGVNRLTLREILLVGLGDRVRFGQTFLRYEQRSAGRVRAWFADGSSTDADLLVGADGTNSAVRGQLIPDAVIDELRWAVYGLTPIGADTLDWLPDALLDSFNRVTGDGEESFAVATCRPREPVADAAARLAPGVELTDIPGYLQWIVPLTDERWHQADAASLHRHAGEVVRRFHPAIRRVVAEADVSATFAVQITSARPVEPWDTPNVTLLGDAIHTMSPGRGDGANIALRDASVLRAALARAIAGEVSLQVAVRQYQTDMLAYGFAAAEASLTQPFGGPQRQIAPTPTLAGTDPIPAWDQFVAKHAVGDVVDATVTASLPIGVFVEVVAGVAGILVGSQLPAGAQVRGRITTIDSANRRLSMVPVAAG